MANQVDVSWEGDKDLIRAIARAGDEADKAAVGATQAGAELVRQAIVRKTPRLSGELANGFVVKRGSWKKNGANAVVTIKSRELVRAFYLEFGAEDRSPGGDLPTQPFIRPAYEETREAAEKVVVAELRKALGL